MNVKETFMTQPNNFQTQRPSSGSSTANCLHLNRKRYNWKQSEFILALRGIFLAFEQLRGYS